MESIDYVVVQEASRVPTPNSVDVIQVISVDHLHISSVQP